MATQDQDSEFDQQPTINLAQVENAKCESCEFTEDCTPAYIALIRQRYNGRWICGLCSEAVKDEVTRSGKMITVEEALERHISFCQEFRSSSSSSSSEMEDPISVFAKIILRSLDSPKAAAAATRSKSTSVLPDVGKVSCASLIRSESCFSSFSG